jgi:hypothetical protein
MTTSNEAFEKILRGHVAEMYEHWMGRAPMPKMRIAVEKLQHACDAHWREKLQSEEMAEACYAAFSKNIGKNFTAPDIRYVVFEKDALKEALAAISKEMGV